MKQYTMEDGLASSRVTCISQDSRGYLWIGTEHGISRFDGIEFTNFYEKNNSLGDYICAVAEVRNGDILVATADSGCVHIHPGDLQRVTKIEGLPSNSVYSLLQDHEGHQWYGTYNGVIKFDGVSYKSFGHIDGLDSDWVTHIATDGRKNIWVGTARGLGFFKGGRFDSYKKVKSFPVGFIYALTTDSGGNLWVGTGHGLFLMQNGVLRRFTKKEGLPSNGVYAICEAGNHTIWLGTGSGLSCYSGGAFANFRPPSSMTDNKITAVFEDREGHIWIGNEQGVGKISIPALRYTSRDGLSSNVIYAIHQDKKGDLWFGTAAGLSRYSGNSFNNYTTADGLPGNTVLALEEDSTGRLWIGTMKGLSVFSAGGFTNYTIKEGLRANLILSLLADENNSLWIGTRNGLCRFKEGKIRSPGPDDAYNYPIHAMFPDHEGKVWFTNTQGVCRVSGDRLTCFSASAGLPLSFVYAIYEDSLYRMWFCSRDGLSYLDKGEFRHFSMKDGLYSNSCYFLFECEKGNLWVGTSRGVNRINGDTLKIYPGISGLTTSELSQGAYLKDNEGNIWFGTGSGAIRFEPGSGLVKPLRPPVYITGLKVFGFEHALDRDIIMQYNENFIEFSFTGFYFADPAVLSYKYRLDKGQWKESKNPSVSYGYLPPGDYSFEVMATTPNGLESSSPAGINFKILPPFWKTAWFNRLSYIMVALAIFLLMLWRNKRAREKAVLSERTRQLGMAQNMELLGILAGGAVHDLKNLLAIILNYSKMVGQDVGKENRTRFVERLQSATSTAVRLAKQILAFTRQQGEEERVANLPDLLDDIVDILKVTIPEEIDTRVEGGGTGGAVLRFRIDPTRFQQVVMNLCINAAQAMPEGGVIRIALFRDTNNRVVLDISDSGSGMDQERIEHIFDPFYSTKKEAQGTGLGLFVVKQIVDDYNGTIHVESSPGKGSHFRIRLPVKDNEEHRRHRKKQKTSF
ncbi:MAG: GHKL domain-containing protein [bacterium]|nr:GHKL domain-containing protein [bacterium]